MVGLTGSVAISDVDRMRARLYLTAEPDRRRKWSAFWVLLVLAAIIASAGVVGDSTATVIGAMIVAPLMTPILGTALALVLADRRRLLHNVGLVLAGAAVVVLIGYLVGLSHVAPVLAENNSQVSSRVSPKLIDLVAALATGVVGAFALVRSDVSDTLPGVAIAISLVPPLAVVGITLESGAPDQARGALLLFATNVAAIIATGTVVLLAYRIRDVVADAGEAIPRMSVATLATVAITVVALLVPLAAGSWSSVHDQMVVQRALPVAEAWAGSESWTITDITMTQGVLRITALGALPEADPQQLRADLNAAGLTGVETTVRLVIGGSKDLGPG